MRRKQRCRTAALAALLILLTFSDCTNGQSPDREAQLSGEHLQSVYAEHARTGIPSFSIVDRTARTLRASGDHFQMVTFLTSHIQRFPMDPNNGPYLIYAGDYYRSNGAPEVARDYYLRALKRYPELIREKENTHVAALNRLLDVTDDPSQRIEHYQELLKRFPDIIDAGRTHFFLAREFERTGQWDRAYEEYLLFMNRPNTDIPGEPDARRTTAQKLSFYDSQRDWTWRDLDQMVQSIKNALWTQNTEALLQHRSKVNFFTMSWEQELSDENSQIPSFDIGFFLRRSRVRFADELDLASNAREAYLRTWGWSHRIPTWYLYFRRVDFPPDPEINGTWEWAGIYFGETL